MTRALRWCGMLATGALLAATPARAQQKVAFARGATPTVSIRLVAMVGEIRVVGWDRDSVELTGIVPSGSRTDLYGGEPGQRAAGMKMYIESPAGNSGRDATLTLRVPRRARVWVKSGSAAIGVTGVTGGLDLNIVGGSITVHGSPAELRAESMDGSVTIEGAPEWMRVKTATGDITMAGGVDIGASSISGTVRTGGGTVERAKLESTTGALVFASTAARGASIELETHSGSIDLAFPWRASVELDAETITGAIDNQWSSARPEAGREGRGMTLRTSGDVGSARVVVRSFKGTVQLRVKKGE